MLITHYSAQSDPEITRDLRDKLKMISCLSVIFFNTVYLPFIENNKAYYVIAGLAMAGYTATHFFIE